MSDFSYIRQLFLQKPGQRCKGNLKFSKLTLAYYHASLYGSTLFDEHGCTSSMGNDDDVNGNGGDSDNGGIGFCRDVDGMAS